MRVTEECLSCTWYGIDCTNCAPTGEALDEYPCYEPQEEEPYPVAPEDYQ